jgi:hypothetical protein
MHSDIHAILAAWHADIGDNDVQLIPFAQYPDGLVGARRFQNHETVLLQGLLGDHAHQEIILNQQQTVHGVGLSCDLAGRGEGRFEGRCWAPWRSGGGDAVGCSFHLCPTVAGFRWRGAFIAPPTLDGWRIAAMNTEWTDGELEAF